MQKLNKNGLFVKRVVGNDFSVGNAVVEGESSSEELAILNLTKEQMDILSYIINSEGRNIPINEDGKIETEIGHTYVITAMETDLTVTDADFNELCKVPAHTQMGFVAKSVLSYVNNVICTVTEVFRCAASVELSGNGSGVDSSVLPAGYTRLKYLESTGEQYIFAPYFVYDEMEYISQMTERTGACICVSGSSDGNNGIYTTEYTSGQRYFRYGPAIGQSFFPLDTFLNVHKVTIKDFELYQNDTLVYSLNKSVFDLSSIDYIGIFARCTINEPSYIFGGLIYSVSYKYRGEMVYKFLPCLDATGTPCMFDIVGRKAYYNIGTGDFLYLRPDATYSLRQPVPEYAKLTETGVRRLYKVPEGLDLTIEDYARAAGFKHIVESEKPEEGYWTPRWRETDTRVILDWVETEPPTDLGTQI